MCVCQGVCVCVSPSHRQAGRQTDTETDTEKERQKEKKTSPKGAHAKEIFGRGNEMHGKKSRILFRKWVATEMVRSRKQKRNRGYIITTNLITILMHFGSRYTYSKIFGGCFRPNTIFFVFWKYWGNAGPQTSWVRRHSLQWDACSIICVDLSINLSPSLHAVLHATPPPVLLQTLPLFALGDTMSHHAAAAEADWYTSNNQESSMIRLKARIDRHKRTEVNWHGLLFTNWPMGKKWCITVGTVERHRWPTWLHSRTRRPMTNRLALLVALRSVRQKTKPCQFISVQLRRSVVCSALITEKVLWPDCTRLAYAYNTIQYNTMENLHSKTDKHTVSLI